MNIDTESLTAVLAFALLLATLNERAIERFLKPMIETYLISHGREGLIPFIAMLTGMIISAGLGVDFITPLAEAATGNPLPWPVAGYIVSGIIVGGGSNFVHSFMQMIEVKSVRPNY